MLFGADHLPLLRRSPSGDVGPASEVAWASWETEVWFYSKEQMREWDWSELIARVNSMIGHWGVQWPGFDWWH